MMNGYINLKDHNMKYTLRAECTHDIEQFKHVMDGYAWNYREVVGEAPIQMTFDCALNKERIIYRLRLIPDSHVMIETLELTQEYTGERTTSNKELT